MELKCTINTEDLDKMDFPSLLTEEIQKEVIVKCKRGIASNEFKNFTVLVSDNITTGVKLKMENFLSEDIALTDRWGKVKFVGSVDDLIKKRFDEVLLMPVDSNGNKVVGCTTTNSKTWLQWRLERTLKEKLESCIKSATLKIERDCKDYIADKLIEIKDTMVKKQVDKAFTSILQQ